MRKILSALFLLILIIIGVFYTLALSLNNQTTFSLYFPKNSPHFWLLYYLSDHGYWDLYGTKVKLTNTPANATLLALKSSAKIPAGYKILLKLSNFEPYTVYARQTINLTFTNKTIILPPKGSKQYRDVVELLSRQGLKPYKDYTPYFDLPEGIKKTAFAAGIGNLLIASTLTPLDNLTSIGFLKAPDIGILAVKENIRPGDLKTIISAVYWGQKAFLQNPHPTGFLGIPPNTQKELFLLLKKESFFPESLFFNPVTVGIAQQYYQNPKGPFFKNSFYQKLFFTIKEKINFKDCLGFVFRKIFS
ncbi:hypothetical protein [Carboxydothermus pertinax]|uniref:Uncharacterized protein n=1 Tax=Carboxydothermus pertinax TaxID=870242 RepID=A0A1L8CS68_9THEO|nr:hypothetical protein [Carboxydothermus pertinax]GAV21659.1 hypothetical protein cpu_01690 [Carboxydothermus pertinax]